jgi:putative Mg2+ transporter-C (MgtC) family protein
VLFAVRRQGQDRVVIAAAPHLHPGQGWPQVGSLALAFGLTALVGLERAFAAKAAGLRTHALVGVGSAVFVLLSKYGFSDVTGPGVAFDPSRVAAQIVSGIGFIGGGIIFVRRDSVQGLTTAATVWLAAGIGALAGAGLPVLALVATGAHFATVVGLGALGRRLTRTPTATARLQLTYATGSGALRGALVAATEQGFTVSAVSVRRDGDEHDGDPVSVELDIVGTPSVTALAAEVAELPGVVRVRGGGIDEEDG